MRPGCLAYHILLSSFFAFQVLYVVIGRSLLLALRLLVSYPHPRILYPIPWWLIILSVCSRASRVPFGSYGHRSPVRQSRRQYSLLRFMRRHHKCCWSRGTSKEGPTHRMHLRSGILGCRGISMAIPATSIVEARFGKYAVGEENARRSPLVSLVLSVTPVSVRLPLFCPTHRGRYATPQQQAQVVMRPPPITAMKHLYARSKGLRYLISRRVG